MFICWLKGSGRHNPDLTLGSKGVVLETVASGSQKHDAL